MRRLPVSGTGREVRDSLVRAVLPVSLWPGATNPYGQNRCRNCGLPRVTCGGVCTVVEDPKVEPPDEPEHYALPAKEMKELGLWEV